MRVASVLAATLVAVSLLPASAGSLLVSSGVVQTNGDVAHVSGRDARVRVEALTRGAKDDGAKVEVELLIDAVAVQRRLKAGAKLAEGQTFSITLPSTASLVGETLTVMRFGDEVKVIVTRPTAVDAMRQAPAKLAAAGPDLLGPALVSAPR
ncbi:MAG: hypothetical protein AAF577_03715 [Pseudomonadota bacterium]